MANRFLTALLILIATTPFVMGCASSIVHGEKYKTSTMDIRAKSIGDPIDIYFNGQTPNEEFTVVGKVVARSYVLERGMEELKHQARELGADGIINVKYERKFSVDYLQDLYNINGDAIILKK
jgi:hypothetical protein